MIKFEDRFIENRGAKMIYFDNSATTKIYPQSLDAFMKTSQRIIGNPSSLHDLGTQATRLLNQARKQIAEILNVASEEILFTSGGTEGDNWILKGTALAKRKFGKHLIISAVEHPAVLESAKQLEELGFEVSIVPVDAYGRVEIDEVESLLRKDTVLVSVMAVNNEIGVLQPIKQIANLLMSYPTVHFHVDAVQAIGKIALEDYLVERVDFATFSAHKFHGPRGVGFIYAKKGKKLEPLITGGGQEFGRRSTTENVAGIVAMAKALRICTEEQAKKRQHMLLIRNYLLESLQTYEKVIIFSKDNQHFAPHILTFGIQGVRGEVLVHAFEEKQIYISTTSACSSKKKTTASTLRAMNIEQKLAETAVRISLDESNTMVEAEQFMIILNHLYEKFSKVN